VDWGDAPPGGRVCASGGADAAAGAGEPAGACGSNGTAVMPPTGVSMPGEKIKPHSPQRMRVPRVSPVVR
jgi:hypothetical protein